MLTSTAGVALLGVVPGAGPLQPTAHAAASCSKQAAAQLRRSLPSFASLRPYSEFGQHVCVDFTGDGRNDLVLTRWEFMNHGAHYWAAYRRTSKGTWVRVAGRNDCCSAKRFPSAGISIDRDGDRVVVSQPVYLSDDPACCPQGGTKSARWGWVNGRLVRLGVSFD